MASRTRLVGVTLVVLLTGLGLAGSTSAVPTIALSPGQAVKWSNGLTCSFQAKATVNAWFKGDKAFLGPAVVCSAIPGHKRWSQTTSKNGVVTKLGPSWLAIDRQAIRQIAFNRAKAGWILDYIPDRGFGGLLAGSPTQKLAGKQLVHFAKKVVAPNGTLVNFGSTGASCGMLSWADAGTLISPERPDIFVGGTNPVPGFQLVCMTPGEGVRDACIMTSVVFVVDGSVHYWQRFDGSHNSGLPPETLLVGRDIRPFGCSI